MRIVIATSEAVPYIKVGGLADVAGALASTLHELGHDVTLVMPKYHTIDYIGHQLEEALPELGVPTGLGTVWCSVYRTDQAGYRTYFIEHHDFFSVGGVYDGAGRGHEFNGYRFAFFSLACLELVRALHLQPDVIHAHDWTTAPIPALLKFRLETDPGWADFAEVGTVLTIHNLAHQGRFEPDLVKFLGLPARAFRPDVMEDLGRVNFLKMGISQACLVNTVSPTYAREILTDMGGAGLPHHLRSREHDLHGILNGVDYNIWNPERDPHLPATYSATDLTGKTVCKAALQHDFGLDEDPDAPLFGVVSRLAHQKGLDLVADALDGLISTGAQLVLLGSGDHDLQDRFRFAPVRYPGRVGVYIGFDNRRAHLIEGGSDLFLMPSRFEPCGLSQIYSLRYGTLPVVRATGGLVDTVLDYDPKTRTGTGFHFEDLSVGALLWAVHRAVDVYRHHDGVFRQMIRHAMQTRFSWERAAKSYLQLYGWAVAKRAHWQSSM